MDIPAPTQPTAGTTRPPVTSAAQLTSDFETFLRMLTAQMQYQDPLNPIDSTDYATQLATFSGVEQAVQTNELLRDLTAQMNAVGLAEMAVLVGKEARSAAPAQFTGGPLTLYPQPSVIGDSRQIVVRDAAGVEVQRMPAPPGADQIDWAGVGANGTPLPPGVYQFSVATLIGGQVVTEDPVETYARVTEVRQVEGQTMLVLTGGATVAAGSISALRES